MNFITPLAIAYVLGSVPFGWLLARAAKLGDIRDIGSGNIGATNVLRTGRRGLALLTLTLDSAKGAAAVMLAAHFYPGLEQFAALAAVAGHMFPVWLRFKGGKGVATSFGALSALAWPVALAAAAVWLAMAYVFRYSSLSALTASALSPFFAFAFGYRSTVWLTTTLAVLIFLRHKKNIRRLMDGTETKIGQKKKHAGPPPA